MKNFKEDILDFKYVSSEKNKNGTHTDFYKNDKGFPMWKNREISDMMARDWAKRVQESLEGKLLK